MNKFIPLMLVSFFIIGTFAAAFNPVLASESVTDSWNTKTSMNQARAGLGVVAVADKIYAIGGFITSDIFSENVVGTNEQYDPKTDTWTTLTSMPTPRANFAIVAHQSKIYCIGNGPTEVYDIATDSWSTKEYNPLDRADLQAHVADEKVFVIASRLLYMYDPITDSWTQKASLPTKTIVQSDPHVYSAVVDNQIIVITYDEDLEILIYDPKTDVWSEGKTTGYHGGFGVAVAVSTSGCFAPQRIYILSGGSSIFFYPTGFIMAYDPLSGTWERVKDDPTPRAKVGVAVLDDVLYVIGGLLLGTDGQKVVTSVNEQYVPIGYHSTLPSTPATTTTSTLSNSLATSKPESSIPSTYLIVAISVVIIGIVLIGCFLLQKKKMKSDTA